MTGVSTQLDHSALAAELDSAWESRIAMEPFSERFPAFTVADAYAVQDAWNKRRLTQGESILGHKIGLTSKAVQEQMGVDEPDYGVLWASRHLPVDNCRAQIQIGDFIAPRVEGELAFRLKSVPTGPEVSIDDVLDATAAIAPAIEVVDSRIRDWRIALVDTIADNASYGAFCLGAWNHDLVEADLKSLGMTMTIDGGPTVTGKGSAALGHPAGAVAWLLTKLAELGVTVREGDIILSGALAATIAVGGDEIATLLIDGQDPLSLEFLN